MHLHPAGSKRTIQETLANIKMKFGLLITYLSIHSTFSFGQDTIQVEPSRFYTSEAEPTRGKDFASRVKYAREDIVFNQKFRKVEYCYYYDNKRICYGNTYQLIGDFTLQIGDSVSSNAIQSWTYRKMESGQYLVYRFHNGLYEIGKAKQLIPFEVIGSLFTMTRDKSDTLWIADYSTVNSANPYSKPKYSYPKASLEDKIYELKKVDQPPTLLTGELIPDTIVRARTDGCLSEPYQRVRTMTFIVTEDGYIKNIEQGNGNFDIEYCPQYILELMTIISNYGQLKPAILNGKPVNVKYIINVDMKNG